ncbi:MAG: HEAT repeat domain-containing protein [Betaproteobacteria bacterium]|nr:HEAT repeat domain-containing protein [Betaproteobacteria bacterium]
MSIRIAGILALCAASLHASALDLPRDGWVRWRVPAAEGAPAWCCAGDWNHRNSEFKLCRLDAPQWGYGNLSREAAISEVDIHVHQTGGVPTQLRALAPSCHVVTESPVKQLANVTADASAAWLARQVGAKAIRSHALAALSVQDGPAARKALLDSASKGRDAAERKESIFWMVQGRGTEGFEMAAPYLRDDTDPKVREHAAFALSQSRARDAAPLLIRAAREDPAPKVRAQAWFWLAQTKAPQTEAAIGQALDEERDGHVREQAVFALSQLGDERGARALIALLENRRLPHDIRKRAVFWLGQSNSDTAIRTLDRLLAATPPR